jgi:hypothetical protein
VRGDRQRKERVEIRATRAVRPNGRHGNVLRNRRHSLRRARTGVHGSDGEGMKRTDQGGSLTAQTTSPLRVGRVLEIGFPTFTPRITIHSERELTVEIVAGDGIGFSDTVAYEAIAVRDDVLILSWQEHIGSTIVHVLDFSAGTAYTAVTPAKGEMKGGLMRLTGRIDIKSDA